MIVYFMQIKVGPTLLRLPQSDATLIDDETYHPCHHPSNTAVRLIAEINSLSCPIGCEECWLSAGEITTHSLISGGPLAPPPVDIGLFIYLSRIDKE